MEVGDWLFFENMGAYTMAAASTFNGFMKPRVHYVVGDSHAPALRSMYRPLKENRNVGQDIHNEEMHKYGSLINATDNIILM